MTGQIDSFISARYVIPVIPENTVLEHYTVAVHDGCIVDLFPSSEIQIQDYQAIHHHVLDQHILIPGLINAHNQPGHLA